MSKLEFTEKDFEDFDFRGTELDGMGGMNSGIYATMGRIVAQAIYDKHEDRLLEKLDETLDMLSYLLHSDNELKKSYAKEFLNRLAREEP